MVSVRLFRVFSIDNAIVFVNDTVLSAQNCGLSGEVLAEAEKYGIHKPVNRATVRCCMQKLNWRHEAYKQSLY